MGLESNVGLKALGSPTTTASFCGVVLPRFLFRDFFLSRTASVCCIVCDFSVQYSLLLLFFYRQMLVC